SPHLVTHAGEKFRPHSSRLEREIVRRLHLGLSELVLRIVVIDDREPSHRALGGANSDRCSNGDRCYNDLDGRAVLTQPPGLGGLRGATISVFGSTVNQPL